ncbi:MAG: hypothetical protein NTW21_12785 [Verrucomicrobia bacterium]|nr:hypothetical protein [Verrucomicrobiota bacterium]
MTKGNNFSGEATGSRFDTLTIVSEPSVIVLGGLGLLALLHGGVAQQSLELMVWVQDVGCRFSTTESAEVHRIQACRPTAIMPPSSALRTLAISGSSRAAGDKWACPAVTPYRPPTPDN